LPAVYFGAERHRRIHQRRPKGGHERRCQLCGMRDVLAHAYFGLSLKVV